jgi:hypothetical protein
MAHSHKLYTSFATQTPEPNYLEECTFMTANNDGNNKLYFGFN